MPPMSPIDPRQQVISDLCCVMHRALMTPHAGGGRDAFTITLDQDGKASVKSEYPDAG
jgi:hypothetical protein